MKLNEIACSIAILPIQLIRKSIIKFTNAVCTFTACIRHAGHVNDHILFKTKYLKRKMRYGKL